MQERSDRTFWRFWEWLLKGYVSRWRPVSSLKPSIFSLMDFSPDPVLLN